MFGFFYSVLWPIKFLGGSNPVNPLAKTTTDNVQKTTTDGFIKTITN